MKLSRKIKTGQKLSNNSNNIEDTGGSKSDKNILKRIKKKFSGAKISIKWKIYGYLLSFVAILLVILWVFQTVYLEEFYERIKIHDLKNAEANIESVIDEDDIDDAIDTIADRYNICILITDTDGKTLYSADMQDNCAIHSLKKTGIKHFYELANNNDGIFKIKIKDLNSLSEYFSVSTGGSDKIKPENQPDNSDGDTAENDNEGDTNTNKEVNTYSSETNKDINTDSSETDKDINTGSSETNKDINTDGNEKNTEVSNQPEKDEENSSTGKPITAIVNSNKNSTDKYDKLPNMPQKNDVENYISVNVVKSKTGDTYVIFTDSIITPVGATVNTLKIQLIYISIIMVLLSLVIALVISKHVSRSIIKINESAKQLAEGNLDITFCGKDYKEVAELSKTLNYATKGLAKADMLQKELLANVSHDLRTPLTMITAYSEIMRDIPGENTPENVQVIIDEANRLTMLVNDLLDISKIQAGVSKVETKRYDLTESIESIIDRHSKMLEPKGYKINFIYDDNVYVDADEFKIYQVVYNLIANAVNYAGDDKIVEVKQIIKDNEKVRIEVTDHGIGIAKDKLENVWERYYKVDKSQAHKRAVLGSGLGLSIVNNILKLHNAEYGVESEEGKGSTFWFEMNIAR